MHVALSLVAESYFFRPRRRTAHTLNNISNNYRGGTSRGLYAPLKSVNFDGNLTSVRSTEEAKRDVEGRIIDGRGARGQAGGRTSGGLVREEGRVARGML